jgi:hypothetical protein
MSLPLATDKQVSFIRTLAEQRQLSPLHEAELTKLGTTLTKAMASVLIGSLKAQPFKLNANGAQPKAETVEPGYYVKDENYFEVVLSKAGRAYAKQLNQRPSGSWGWDYAKGAVALLSSDDKLTAEQAAEFGWMHGTCMRCCADLTVPESVERGYGPVCAAKMGF